MTIPVLWSAPRLLIPIAVEALVVNNLDQRHTQWAINPNLYGGRRRLEPVSPHPFSHSRRHSRVGVTLHWGLPDALTRGAVSAGDELTFPLIPNRWLILRLRTTPGTSLKMRGWVLESDYLDPVDGTNPYPLADGSLTRIGRHHDLAEWKERTDLGEPFLTTQGPGDMTFAAYVAHNDNVLSFHDDLDDPDIFQGQVELDRRQPAATFSYLVAGWYAQPEADPLSQWLKTPPDEALTAAQRTEQLAGQLQSMLGDKRWSLGGDEGDLARAKAAIDASRMGNSSDREPEESFPWQSLCHGLVHGVRWTGVDGRAQSGVPTVDADALAVREQGGPSWTVQAGDTAAAVAATMYGDPAGAARIISRNNLTAAADDLLPVGQKLTIPQRKTDIPHIAIGNSSSEALAAMVEYLVDRSGTVDDSSDIAALLQAAQYGLLDQFDQPAGRISLDQAVHKEWFAAHSAGIRWQLVPPRRDIASANAGEAGPVVQAEWAPTRGQQELLDQFNKDQADWEAAQQTMRDAQGRLYDLWVKWKRFPFEAKPLAGVPGEAEAFAERLQVAFTLAVKEVVKLANTMPASPPSPEDAQKRLDDLADMEATERPELVSQENPRYYQPADPVVAIFGGQRSTKHGNDGRFRADNTLFCRVSGQTNSALTIQPGEQISADDLIESVALDDLLPANKPTDLLEDKPDHLPRRDIRALIIEALILDPTLSERVTTPANQEALRQRQQLFWSSLPGEGIDEAEQAQAAGLNGLIPSPHSVVAWRPPWSPLFMSWQVTWYPTSRDPGTALASWTFDPHNGLEYDWTGAGLPDHKNVLTISGRSILADADLTQMVANLEESLAALEKEKEAGQLRLISDQLASADLLVQTMSGFHDQLLMRARDQGYLPDETEHQGNHNLRQLMGEAIHGGAPVPYANGAPESHFYPLRAGHVRFNRLWIIDSFGQVFDPIDARGQIPSSFVPLRGSGLATAGKRQRGDSQVLQFPPRLLQPARLWFDFTPAGSKADPENPICGWLLPNYHDHALAVYDQAGTPLGTLMSMFHDDRVVLGWAAADSLALTSESPDLSAVDDTLHGVIDKLFRRPDNYLAFTDFMTAIDRALWTADPQSSQPARPSLLIGRPIALARARLRLETAGPAAVDQLWGKTFTEPSTPWYEGLQFKVQLGDILLRHDGTLGFYDEDDFTVLNATHPNLTREHDSYVNGSVRLLDLTLNAMDEAGQPLYRQVALLCDPHGQIHARSGILPTTAIALPARALKSAAASMDVTFRVGPLLTEANKIRMPLPAELHGSWSWLEKTGVNLAPGPPIEPLSEAVTLNDPPPIIREGWLKLADRGLDHVNE